MLCLKYLGRAAVGCMYCATVVGSDALNATYSWTAYEATLLQTASIYSVHRGFKKKEKTLLTSGKSFSHGSITQSPCTYHTLYPLHVV